jgi:tetratricopeptide (TPR) repeat protein
VGQFRKKSIAVVVCLCASLRAARVAGVSVDALIEAGHWKRARQISLARIATEPNDAQAHAWLAKIASSFGDLETSVREAERAVQLDARNPSFHGQLAESCALTADQSSILKGLGYVRRMKREIDAALALDPNHVDTLLVDMMFSWKAPALAGGDKQKARRIADRILSVSPTWGYLAQARLLQFQGEPPATEAILQRAVAANPRFYRARASLATYYCGVETCRSPEQAERVAQEAIAIDPAAEPAYSALARAYATQKRWADLDAVLARAEAAVPDDLEPYYSAADRLIRTGQDPSRAERYLRRYLSQPPEGREPTHAEARRLLEGISRHRGTALASLAE